jgi:hypothetical protein
LATVRTTRSPPEKLVGHLGDRAVGGSLLPEPLQIFPELVDPVGVDLIPWVHVVGFF